MTMTWVWKGRSMPDLTSSYRLLDLLLGQQLVGGPADDDRLPSHECVQLGLVLLSHSLLLIWTQRRLLTAGASGHGHEASDRGFRSPDRASFRHGSRRVRSRPEKLTQ